MPNLNPMQAGSRYRVVDQELGTVTLVANGQASLELPNNFAFKEIHLFLAGTITVSSAGTGLGSDEVPLELIKNIQIIGDGRKQLLNVSGRDLYRFAHFMTGSEPYRTGPTTAGTQTNTPTECHLFFDFQAARMAFRPDSYLDPRVYKKVELKITFGQLTDIIVSGTATLGPTTVRVQLLQTAKGEEFAVFNRLFTHSELTVESTNTARTERVPESGLLAHILLATRNAQVTSNAVLNSVTLKSDNAYLHMENLNAAMLQRRNWTDFELGGGSAVVSATARIPGYYFLNVTEDGMINSALNTWALNTLDLIMNVTGAAGNIMRVNYLFYEPIVPVGSS